jgi:ParB/RepB/Spo0J family partition protein
MQETMKIRKIELSRLWPHPDHANRMSRAAFGKLMRHIKRTGYYEPLVVRPHPHPPAADGCFQILHGHHRCEALRRLGYETAQAIVWRVDDEQADILLATLNRLAGRDCLDRKLAILRRLRARRSIRELAQLLPQTRGQLERLTGARPLPGAGRASKSNAFATPMVFFVSDEQHAAIESALTALAEQSNEPTKAARRAAALTQIARTAHAGANNHSPLPPAAQERTDQ